MEISYANSTSSKYNQMQNVNTVWRESRNFTTLPGVSEIDDKISEVIAFVVNSNMNVTPLHYILKCIHLEWRLLFGPFRYMLIQNVRFIV